MRGMLLSIVVVCLAGAPAVAAFVYGGQNRQVATITGFEGGGASTSDLKDTAATGFWSETAASSYSNPPPNAPNGSGGIASASASQTSNLGNFEISMSGTLAAGATLAYVGHAQSYLGVSFSLASDTNYVSSFSSTGPTVNFTFVNSGSQPYGANSSGILPAGTYSLSVDARASSNSGDGGPYAYNLSIAGVPEPSSGCVMLATILVAAALRAAAGHWFNCRW